MLHYKIEWYVNDQFVSNQPEFTWIVTSHTTRVYFEAFYLSSDGVESIGTSPNFNLLAQDLDFPANIAISNASPAYGCTDPISLSLPETPCTGSYCDLTFNVNGNYNITWQVPAGWTISSSSDKGSNVTFVPDNYTDEDITATIHFTGCNDFTETSESVSAA